jgi:anti-sigma B factor antagonist
MNLEVRPLANDAGVIVTVPGEHLDVGNSKPFREALQPVLEDNDTVLLDLGAVDFIDSSGLGSLLSCLRAMNAKDGELRLFGMRRPVQAMFELVRMHRLFAIYDTEEEACATLS